MKRQTEKYSLYSSVGRSLLAALGAVTLMTACGNDSDPAETATADSADSVVPAPATAARTSPSSASADLEARHSEPSGYSVRDSAGIQVIETAGSAWTEETAWTVGPEPLASLGGERTGGTSLHGAGRIVILSSGGFVVAHPQGSQLVWFDPNGRFQHAAGHLGRSPGAFMIVGDILAMPGDSVLAVDPEVRRVSVFGPDGEFARLESIDFREAGSPSAVSVLSDGTILGTREFEFEEGMSAGLNRDSVPLVILQPGGGFTNTRTLFPTSQHWLFEFGEGLAGGPAPFGAESHVAGTVDGFWFGSGDTAEITYHGADGRLQKILRWQGSAEPLPAERFEKFEADAMAAAARNGAALAEMRNFLRDLPSPDTTPYLGGMIVDPDGRLWIRPYHVWTEQAGGWWTVFDADGRRMGMVEIPAGFEIRAIGSDRIYGVWTAEDGVESVRVYALNK
jgi:hypothetical protein